LKGFHFPFQKFKNLRKKYVKGGQSKELSKVRKKTAKKFNNPKEEIMIWGLGIAGEAGDVASCIKKTFGHDNDQIKGIRENIGDAFWYMAEICNFFGWDMEEIVGENIEKLKKRYP